MRRNHVLTSLTACAAAAFAVAGCGEHGIQIAKSDPLYEGAYIFQQRCAACHTFDTDGAQGGAVKINDREYKDGPNFNVRCESKDSVLYAIRNGGFSSGPMPQNIVTGDQAERVADFVSKYAGGADKGRCKNNSTTQQSSP